MSLFFWANRQAGTTVMRQMALVGQTDTPRRKHRRTIRRKAKRKKGRLKVLNMFIWYNLVYKVTTYTEVYRIYNIFISAICSLTELQRWSKVFRRVHILTFSFYMVKFSIT